MPLARGTPPPSHWTRGLRSLCILPVYCKTHSAPPFHPQALLLLHPTVNLDLAEKGPVFSWGPVCSCCHTVLISIPFSFFPVGSKKPLFGFLLCELFRQPLSSSFPHHWFPSFTLKCTLYFHSDTLPQSLQNQCPTITASASLKPPWWYSHDSHTAKISLSKFVHISAFPLKIKHAVCQKNHFLASSCYQLF